MSLDPPTLLGSLQGNIRQRPVPWDGAVRAGTLTEEQLAKIRAVDKVKKDARKQTVEADLDGYRTLFVGGPGKQSVLELAAKRQDVVQYILVLLNDLLDSACLPLRLPPAPATAHLPPTAHICLTGSPSLPAENYPT
jgi:V-type H+-transporting ATPase subunit H